MKKWKTQRISLLVGLGLLLLICGRIDAEEPDISSATFDGGDEFYLYAFSEKSVLMERGISCDSFIFGTDNWILDELLSKPEFRTTLAKLPDLPDYLTNNGCAELQKDQKESQDFDFWLISSLFTDDLLEKLTQQEIHRLPYVYLRLEGLSALVRPQFRNLFEKPESQQELEILVRKLGTPAGLFYGRFISPPPLTEEDFMVCHAGLRRLSADLDRAIYKFLSAEERKRVANLLKSSSALDRIVVPPAIHR